MLKNRYGFAFTAAEEGSSDGGEGEAIAARIVFITLDAEMSVRTAKQSASPKCSGMMAGSCCVGAYVYLSVCLSVSVCPVERTTKWVVSLSAIGSTR
jgi:hypothetical protein